MKKLLLSLVCVLTISEAAFATSFAAVATSNFESPKAETAGGTSVNYSSKMGLGLGGLIGIDMGSILILETGALIVNRKYSDVAGTTTVGVTRLQVPALIKFNALPIISFGAGPYVEFALGDVGSTDSSGTTTTNTYDQANFDSMDYGLAASVNADISLLPSAKLFLDVRYNLGLKDLDRSTASFKFSSIQFLAGVKFVL